ncbi:cell envelope-related function transcriptional attenuator common domain-containing protein [Actinopolymorpha singaporensis]|uniref:Cell envelope-related function transcriptional attenuator common domain-containing protein n=1 Tax=Actinopolymorpha singaporensis TaxID=117157 RepID=A0A1H1P2Y4_9ACTN|nr:cell envelope-related function transcriptional attenuator common domain-containing protein [Actinopolymorpha singaporensis]
MSRDGAREYRSTRVRRRRGCLTVLLLLVAMVCAVAVARTVASRLNDNLRAFDGRGIGTNRPAPVKPARDGAVPANLLLIGSDSRAGTNDQLAGGSGAAGRSDTAIVVHVYADHRRAVAVSIPRDALVDIPRCRLPDGSWAAPRRQTMFNAAFNTGSTDAGNPACTQNTVENLTGLRVDHTIVVDFKGFAAITEAVGGVRVCVPKDVYTGDLNPNLRDRGSLLFAKGVQTVSGQRALGYVRLRHGIGDGSDIGRIKRQQAFLASLAAKIRRSGIDPVTLAPLAEAATRALTVDPGLGSAPKLVAFAMSLRHAAPARHPVRHRAVSLRRTDEGRVRPACRRPGVGDASSRSAAGCRSTVRWRAALRWQAPLDSPPLPGRRGEQQPPPGVRPRSRGRHLQRHLHSTPRAGPCESTAASRVHRQPGRRRRAGGRDDDHDQIRRRPPHRCPHSCHVLPPCATAADRRCGCRGSDPRARPRLRGSYDHRRDAAYLRSGSPAADRLRQPLRGPVLRPAGTHALTTLPRHRTLPPAAVDRLTVSGFRLPAYRWRP